jgi:4-hydroxy-3-polyprenylbenzoate decarboxylase
MTSSIVVGVTGASGVIYARRLLQALANQDRHIDLVISPAAELVMWQELGVRLGGERFSLQQLWPEGQAPSIDVRANIKRYGHGDFLAPIASGSHVTAGMVVCPCSGSTLSAVACGASNNLIQRAADVHLKERRPLILVTRETPLSLIHIENMRRCVQAGAIMLPASPGWYHGKMTIDGLVDFVVARILDQLGIEHTLSHRWGNSSSIE